MLTKIFIKNPYIVMLMLTSVIISSLLFTTATSAMLVQRDLIEKAFTGIEYDATVFANYTSITSQDINDLVNTFSRVGKDIEGINEVIGVDSFLGLSFKSDFGTILIVVASDEKAEELGLEDEVIYVHRDVLDIVPDPIKNLTEVVGLKLRPHDYIETLRELISIPRTVGSFITIQAPLVPPPNLLLISKGTLIKLLDVIGDLSTRFGLGLKHVLSYYFLKIDKEAYVNIYSVDDSLRRLKSICSKVVKVVREEVEADVDYSVANVENALRTLQMQGMIIRFALVFGNIPAFIIVFIATRKLVEVLVISIRRYVGLLRLRGLPPKKLVNYMTRSLSVWIVVGAFAGLAIAILVTSFFVSLSELGSIFTMIISDYITTMVYIALAIAIPLIAAWRGFTVVRNLPLTEIVKPTRIIEDVVLREKLGTGSLIALILGCYFVISSLIGFSPSRVLMEGGPSLPVVVVIVLVILTIIDSFLMLFGPPLFIYGISKLVVSKPEILYVATSKLASLVTRKYATLIGRLAMLRSRRVAVALLFLLMTFSTLISSGITTQSYANYFSKVSLYLSGSDILASKPLNIHNITEELRISDELVRGLGNDLTTSKIYMLMLRGRINIECGDRSILSGYSPLVVIEDPNAFIESSYSLSDIGYGFDFIKVMREGTKGLMIFYRKFAGGTRLTDPYEDLNVSRGESLRLSVDVGEGMNKTLINEFRFIGFIAGFPGLDEAVTGIAGIGAVVRGFVRRVPTIYHETPMVVMDSEGVKELINDLKSKDLLTGTIVVYYIKLREFSTDRVTSLAKELKEQGFDVVTRVDIETYISSSIFVSMYSSPFSGISSDLSGFIMGVVGAAIMMVIVWLSFIESKRVYVLLRIRGSSKGDLFKLMITEWVAVTSFLILLSIVLGIGSGFGVIKKMVPPLAYMLPFIGVDPSISTRSLMMLLLLTVIIVTSLILMVIKIYRGVARESLLRVM